MQELEINKGHKQISMAAVTNENDQFLLKWIYFENANERTRELNSLGMKFLI